MMRLLWLLLLAAPSLGQDLQLVPSEGVKDETPSAAAARPSAGSGTPFVATHKWQEIAEGQHVPAGLHYRMNMETGKREAKLLPRAGSQGDAAEPIDIKNVAKALKDVKDVRPSDLPKPSERKRKAAELRSAQRPLAALKDQLDEAKLSLLSDGEVIGKLLDELRKPGGEEARRLQVLEDLEYYVHQIDNAVSFVDRGGLGLMKAALNASSAAERGGAALVLGGAAGSNPDVQRAMLEEGLVQALGTRLATEAEDAARKKAVFAFSALLRNFPAAQRKFLQLGGPELFAQAYAVAPPKDRVKILTLLLDLVEERRIADQLGSEGAVQSTDELATLKAYAQVSVLSRLAESGWCGRMGELLGLSDWDSQEKVLNAMHGTLEVCRGAFAESRPAVERLSQTLRGQLDQEPDNDYLQDLLGSADRILHSLSSQPTHEPGEL